MAKVKKKTSPAPAAAPAKPSRGKWRLVAAVVVVAGTIATVVWWQRTSARLAVVESSIPAAPDVSAAPAELKNRLTDANERAHRGSTAVDALKELSRLYHANGFLDEAVRCYLGLEQLEPREPRWLHLHATILAGYGDIEPALQLWDRVVALAPDYIPTRLRIGDAQLKSNRTAPAAAAYNAVLQREPKNPYALFGLARIDFEAKRWPQAREKLETVVNDTNYEIGYDLIVSLYEEIGETERARVIRSSAKASGAYRDPADPWLDGLADDCYDSFRLALSAGVAERFRDTDGAIRLLRKAIQLSPNDVSANFQLGRIAMDHGDTALAKQQLERCTVLSPDFADAWAWLSSLYSNSGDKAGADRILLTGLSKSPQSPGLHLMRARSLRDANRIGEAANEFATSIHLRPNEPDPYIELGQMLIAAGQSDAGVEQIRAALVAEPGNPMATGILAFHTITTGSESESRAWLRRVAQQPRIPRDTVERLLAAYRETFGHEYVADR
jgi:tetratricopeptide (TPR) repeat protein